MPRFWDREVASTVIASACVVATLCALCQGCRNAPFYRMTSKASQSLPLSREGIVAYERGDLNLAEEKFEEALKLNDSDVETNRYYGETLWRQGKRDEAMVVLTNAAEKNGAVDSETALFCSLSEKSLELDEPSRALAWSNKIIDLTPKRVEGWRLRGYAYRRLGRPREALLDLQRAAHFLPDDRALLRDIATIQNEIGDYDSALATWQCLERLYPTNREPAEVFAGKGGAYVGMGLLREAEESFEIAAKYEPNVPEYRLRLAETLLARGNVDRANLIVAQTLKADPGLPEAVALMRATQSRMESVARSTEAETNVH